MARLSITLFGSFRVGLDGEAVTAFSPNKERGLLAYLEQDKPHPTPPQILRPATFGCHSGQARGRRFDVFLSE